MSDQRSRATPTPPLKHQAMNSEWREDQRGRLLGGTSVFGHIPAEIGEIIYCDSSTAETEPMSPKKALITRVVTVAVYAVVMALVWLFLSNMVWKILITLFATGLAWTYFDTRFMGYDYFVGDKGFAKLKFVTSRSNIVSKEVVLFDEITEISAKEKIERYVSKAQFGKYHYTACHFNVYGYSDDGALTSLYRSEGRYEEEHPVVGSEPYGADDEYRFMKMVEAVWSS